MFQYLEQMYENAFIAHQRNLFIDLTASENASKRIHRSVQFTRDRRRSVANVLLYTLTDTCPHKVRFVVEFGTNQKGYYPNYIRTLFVSELFKPIERRDVMPCIIHCDKQQIAIMCLPATLSHTV